MLLRRNEAEFGEGNETEYMPHASWDTYVLRVDTTLPREGLVLEGNETHDEYDDRSYVERVNQQRGWDALSKRAEKLKSPIELVPLWKNELSVVVGERQDGKGRELRMVRR